MKKFLLILLVLLLILPTLAQEELNFETVQVEAADGLLLVGDFYRPTGLEGTAPAILLMHQNQANRATFAPLIPHLVEAGYFVVTVDLRGFGETGGSRDFELALGDVGTWFAWLKTQEGVDASRLAAIGASIGSNLALVGCASEEACITAVALSPGENYFNIEPMPVFEAGLDAFVVAAQRDRESSVAIENFFAAATGEVMARMYSGSAHGTALFIQHLDSLAATILLWLEERFAAVETSQ